MSDPKNQKPSAPDSLTKTSQAATIELTECDLDKVTGGRVKTADKQSKAVGDFVKG